MKDLKNRSFFLFFFVFLVSLVNIINVGYCSAVDLDNIPEFFADALGVSEFAGGLLASLLLVVGICMPFMAVSIFTGRVPLVVMGIVGILGTFFCCAISWLDSWVIIIIVLIVALGLAKSFRDWVE